MLVLITLKTNQNPASKIMISRNLLKEGITPLPLPNLKNRKMKSCIKEHSKPQETPSSKDPYDYNIDFKGNGLIEKYNQFKHQFGRKYVIKPKERLKVTFKNISKNSIITEPVHKPEKG